MDISVTATTATISYLITAIAYTPERYRVEYHGLELQPHLNVTDFTYSSTDIVATNQSFTATLTGLEEANTYSFVVVAVNCLGNTTTKVMSLITLSACKLSYMIHYMIQCSRGGCSRVTKRHHYFYLFNSLSLHIPSTVWDPNEGSGFQTSSTSL